MTGQAKKKMFPTFQIKVCMIISQPKQIKTSKKITINPADQRYGGHKQVLAQILQFLCKCDLENGSKSPKHNEIFIITECYVHATLQL